MQFTTSPQAFYSGDPVAITAGSPAEIEANVAVALNSGSWTSASGTQVDSGATLAGTGVVNSSVAVTGGGTLDPGTPVGMLNVNSLVLNSTTNVSVTLDSAASGDFSQLNYNTNANLNGANLKVLVDGNLNVGDSFTIVSTSGGTLNGVFGSGAASITAANNPFYVFGVSYAGAQVTLTVTSVPVGDVVDVQGNTVDFYTLTGLANNLTVGLSGGHYSITDSVETISLTAAAIAAGWTGGGTNTVTGPNSYTNFAFFTQDAADTVEAMNLGNANLSLTGDGTGTLNFVGNVTTTGNINVSDYTAITDGLGVLTSNGLTMTAPNGIGTASNPILTAAQSDNATASAGAVYITQTGTGSVTVSAAGVITVSGASGTLTVAATSTDANNGNGGPGTGSDAVTLSSADSLVLGGDVNAGGAEIIINADTDGLAAAGTASYNQAGFSLITTDLGDDQYFTGPDAAIITVNANGGLGDAIIGMGSIGTNAGGEITVTTNGGNILWSSDPIYGPFTASQTGLASGGSNTQTLKANDYVLDSSTPNAAETLTAGVAQSARTLGRCSSMPMRL